MIIKSSATPPFFSFQDRVSESGKTCFQTTSRPDLKLSTVDLLARNKVAPFSGESLATVKDGHSGEESATVGEDRRGGWVRCGGVKILETCLLRGTTWKIRWLLSGKTTNMVKRTCQG
jgi:hypothetical protein